jgi:hypothetical protein
LSGASQCISDGTLFLISYFSIDYQDRIQFPHQIENNRCKFEQPGRWINGRIKITLLYQIESGLARLLHDKDVAGECS